MQADSAQDLSPEDQAYTIYVFEKNEGDEACAVWRRHSALPGRKQALAAGRALFGSGAYCRVEVKTRFFDRRRRCARERILRCWTEKSSFMTGMTGDRLSWALPCGMIVAAAVVFGWMHLPAPPFF